MENLRAVVRKRVWVARLDIPHGIEEKIKTKHNLTADDVQESIVGVTDVTGEVQTHERYGSRLKVWATTYDGIEFVAYLYLVEAADDHYRLGSAFEE
ncbi:hypothetical protein ACWEPN_31495 [Nonomuraea wenchangensis]